MNRKRKFAIFSTIAMGLMTISNLAAAPAPPLSYVEVRFVGSSTQGWEATGENQLATAYDHGGALLRVVTVEVGYGSNPVAQFNGATLPRSANYQTDAFCNYSNFLEPCRAGQTIVGYVRYWNLDGQQSGSFWYQNTSINSPWNTLGDRMYIQ